MKRDHQGAAHSVWRWVTLKSAALKNTAVRSAVLHWVFPLSHTWTGWSRQVFESFWAPLHLAWVFLCACLLAATRSASAGRRRGVFQHRVLWWGGLILTYAATAVGCWLVVMPQPDGAASRVGPLVLLVLEYGVLAILAARVMARSSGRVQSDGMGNLSTFGETGDSPERGGGTSVSMTPAATLEKGNELC